MKATIFDLDNIIVIRTIIIINPGKNWPTGLNVYFDEEINNVTMEFTLRINSENFFLKRLAKQKKMVYNKNCKIPLLHRNRM
ncbi:MAG: hypothetical protein FWE14_05230 [Lachnospiraceae bacterium]|nr:hypothetical protein [Lachnospiraceae bacterium]